MRENEIEVLATFVHGALAALHVLGFLYNLRRRNALDAIAHGCAAVYDCGATLKHARSLTAVPRAST